MEHEFIKLYNVEWFNISGRGKVAVIDMRTFPKERKLLIGDKLYIDDKLYQCNGIGLTTPPSNKQGILVKDIDGE